MAKMVSESTGLYLYAADFYHHDSQPPYSLLGEKKTQIIRNYLDKVAPQLFAARASAAFGGANLTAVDNFFKGGNDTNSGYISNLQAEIDKYYTDSWRNAKTIFSSGLSRLNAKLTNTKGPITADDLTPKQQEDLSNMMAAQKELIDNLSLLSSIYEPYVLQRCAEAGYKPPRMLSTGLYDLRNYKNEGVIEAINIFNDIQSTLQTLKIQAVGSDLSHSFVAFRTTADAFHAKYAEYLMNICAYNVNKARKELFTDSPFDVKWTGTKQYVAGSGDINIDITNNFDQDIQNLINQNLSLTNNQFTATNDVTITSSDQNITGTWGSSVKNYSDKSIKALHGLTTISAFSNIYDAATLASQYGLPTKAAQPIWIQNLAGALNAGGTNTMGIMLWNEFKDLLAKLLLLDALMGRMLNGNISSDANNLIFFSNGKVIYMGDILKSALQEDIHGFSGSIFNQTNLNTQSETRVLAERAHRINWYQGKSAAEGVDAIDAIVKQSNLKISIDLNTILARF